MNICLNDILSELKNKDFYNICVKEKTTSTNALLKEKAKQGAKEGEVLIALSQSDGRGRLGRNFYSQEGIGLYFSIILRPNLKPGEAVLITTVAAVSVCRAIEEMSDNKALVKWVNDVYVNGKKVCGILTEAGFNDSAANLDYVVLGIGVNVFEPKDGFPEDIKNIAGAIFNKAENGIRAKLCAKILDNFYEFYKNLSGKNFVDEYISRSCVIGREIKVISNGTAVDAVCTGIDQNCRLEVKYKEGTKELLSSGEISIKIKPV